MLINTKEIISIINRKREVILECLEYTNNFLSQVTLYDDKNERLISGFGKIGDSEYNDCVYFDEEVKEADFEYFTIQHINWWLNADRATVYILEDNKEIQLSL